MRSAFVEYRRSTQILENTYIQNGGTQFTGYPVACISQLGDHHPGRLVTVL